MSHKSHSRAMYIVDTPFLLFIPLLSFFFLYFFQSVQLLLVDVFLSITVML